SRECDHRRFSRRAIAVRRFPLAWIEAVGPEPRRADRRCRKHCASSWVACDFPRVTRFNGTLARKVPKVARKGPMLQYALSLAVLGMPVFPCLPRSKQKQPATPHGFKDATTDPAIVEQWWHANPDCNK